MIGSLRKIASITALSAAFIAAGCNRSNNIPVEPENTITKPSEKTLTSTLAKVLVDTTAKVAIETTDKAIKEIEPETVAKITSTFIDALTQPPKINVKPFKMFKFDTETFEVIPTLTNDEIMQRLEKQNVNETDRKIFTRYQLSAASNYNRRVNTAISKTKYNPEDLRDNGTIYEIKFNPAHFVKVLKKRLFGEPIIVPAPDNYNIDSIKLIRFTVGTEAEFEGIYFPLPGENLSKDTTLRGNVFLMGSNIVVFIQDGDKEKVLYVDPSQKEKKEPPIRVVVPDGAVITSNF